MFNGWRPTSKLRKLRIVPSTSFLPLRQCRGLTDKPTYSNHGSFFVNQIAPLKLYLGDTQGAAQAVKLYFSGKFQDQIAQSGEQPFEAVRTRYIIMPSRSITLSLIMNNLQAIPLPGVQLRSDDCKSFIALLISRSSHNDYYLRPTRRSAMNLA